MLLSRPEESPRLAKSDVNRRYVYVTPLSSRRTSPHVLFPHRAVLLLSSGIKHIQ